MLTSQTEVRVRTSLIATVVILTVALMGTMASSAPAQGPIHALVSKAKKSADASRATKKGALVISQAVPAKSRTGRSGRHGRFPAPAPRPNEESPTTPAPPTSPGEAGQPVTSISGGPGATTTSTSAKFTLTSSETASTFSCKLDGGAWGPCASPKIYKGLSVGGHDFSARATNADGVTDPTPATKAWTIDQAQPPPDTTPPNTSISGGPSATTTSSSASFTLASTESGSSFECKLDGGGWAACSSPNAYAGLAVGAHTFSARATDPSGNTDPSAATDTWTIEEMPVAEEAEKTPPPSTECTATVSSTSAVQAKLGAGKVVCLADGSYGALSFSGPGTVTAEHPGKATLTTVSLSGNGATIARVHATDGIRILTGADNATVFHNLITGGGEGVDACPSDTTYCTNMQIIGNKLVGPFGEDGIHANRYHGLLIEGNEITKVAENGAHSDCLQTVFKGDHLVFDRNYLHDNRCQGFFVKDQTLSGGEGEPGGPVDGIKVEDNLFLRDREPCAASAPECGQPMYFQLVGPYTEFVMRRNTIWGDDVDSIAAFREGTGSDSLIEDNVIYRMWTDTNMTPATMRNNTRCLRETGSGGSWSAATGETVACSLNFGNTAADDYRLGGERGVDWAPAEEHYGP